MAELELLAGQRQEGETSKAVLACNDYLRMGAGRSLSKLLDRYHNATDAPPTKREKTLKDWSRNFDWQTRVTEYDAGWEQRKTAARNAEINTGLALDFERIGKLKRLADFLEAQIYQQAEVTAIGDPETDDDGQTQIEVSKRSTYPNVWLRDVKGIGQGESFERVEVVRFNTPLLSEYRAVLADLAAETGGRVKKQDVTSGGEKVQVVVTFADS